MATASGIGDLTKEGVLIAVEGTDGSGKTTCSQRLADDLRTRGHRVHLFRNRTFRPVREALNRVAHEEGCADRFEMLGKNFGQLIPSVIKWRDLLTLEAELRQAGNVVIVDRYIYAQFALAQVWKTDNEPLLRQLYRIFPKPDITLFLDVDPLVAHDRVLRRGVDANTREFLADFRSAFRNLPEYESFALVDAEADPDTVYSHVLAAVERHLPAPDAATEPVGARS